MISMNVPICLMFTPLYMYFLTVPLIHSRALSYSINSSYNSIFLEFASIVSSQKKTCKVTLQSLNQKVHLFVDNFLIFFLNGNRKFSAEEKFPLAKLDEFCLKHQNIRFYLLSSGLTKSPLSAIPLSRLLISSSSLCSLCTNIHVTFSAFLLSSFSCSRKFKGTPTLQMCPSLRWRFQSFLLTLHKSIKRLTAKFV